ncbi:MAG: hypothetical protein JXB03_07305 [Spirochaetales bacterium]|nr:hypothetical protein [Spirochaetales bacterium]
MKKAQLLGLCILACALLPLAADVPYDSYTYNRWMEPVEAPHAFVPDTMLRGEDLGVSAFSAPHGLFVHPASDEVYLADTGNDRIIRFDRDFNVLKVYEGFNEPHDVFVTGDGTLYVADTGNARIAVVDAEGDLVIEYGTPESDLIPEGFVYRPLKVALDRAFRIYVVAQGVNEGLIELNKDGVFKQYFGATKVTLNPADYLWRVFSTQAQRRTMRRIVPTVYNNITIDTEGFIFTTTSAYTRQQIESAIYWGNTQVTPIRRLNPQGDDILKRDDFYPPVGDILFVSKDSSIPGASSLCDIAIDDIGIYYVLDQRRGRIFAYDPDGKLITIFGGLGNREGLLRIPVAIGLLGDRVLVLDSQTDALSVYSPTTYGKDVITAITDYYEGRYDRSKENWEKALAQNANLEWAYYGIGNALYREDKFEEAMRYFQIIRHPDPFSRAFKYHRKEVAERNFGWFVMAVVLIFILYRGLKFYYKKRMKGTVKS